jgi:hypothetical protein
MDIRTTFLPVEDAHCCCCCCSLSLSLSLSHVFYCFCDQFVVLYGMHVVSRIVSKNKSSSINILTNGISVSSCVSIILLYVPIGFSIFYTFNYIDSYTFLWFASFVSYYFGSKSISSTQTNAIKINYD